MSLVAAIDIGSNAVRMAIGAPTADGKVEVVESHREFIRLGGEVFASGEVSPDTMQRLVATFQRFATLLERHKVGTVRAVATSATREARNRDELVRAVQHASGISIEVIPGEEEARLIYQAVASRVKLEKRTALLMDIGGGSMELSVVINGMIVVSESLNTGTVRLLQLLEARKSGEKLFARLTQQYVDAVRRRILGRIGSRKLDLCVGTGGNIEALGDLRRSYLGKGDGGSVTRRDLDEILSALKECTVEERAKRFNLRPDRADVVVPAAILVQRVLFHAGIKELTIPKVGLKDGVLIDLALRATQRYSGDLHRQVTEYALEVGRKFSFDEEHARRVAQLALQLFDQLTPIHGLTESDREILEVAALLHDIGQYLSMQDHHKHSAYLIRATPLIGVDGTRKELVALVARYHRKAQPKSEHADFVALNTDQQTRVRKLAAILRLAEALDCEHAGVVRGVRVKLRESDVALELDAQGDALLERWALARKQALFERVFARRVTLADR